MSLHHYKSDYRGSDDRNQSCKSVREVSHTNVANGIILFYEIDQQQSPDHTAPHPILLHQISS